MTQTTHFIRIDSEKCVSCLICMKSCPVGAIEKKDDRVTIDSSQCVYCGDCLAHCPDEAIVISTEKEHATQELDSGGICIYVEHYKGKILPCIFELVSAAKGLQEQKEQKLYALLIGEKVENIARQLLHLGFDEIWMVNKRGISNFAEDIRYNLISEMLVDLKPSIFLGSATAQGKSLFPRIAARLRTGLCADCTDLKIDRSSGNGLIVTRPTNLGEKLAQIRIPVSRPQMATVKTNVYESASFLEECYGKIVDLSDQYNLTTSAFTFMESIYNEQISEGLETTEVIVAVGRGIKNAKNLQLIYSLANVLGGKVAVTRPLVEYGWMDSSSQIGLTGKIVRPKLFIACGLSGAIQHRVGMQHSETIIAINTDQNAPIFDYSTFGIVGDLFRVIPEILSVIQKKE